MDETQQWITYVSASALISLAPGPDNLAVLMQSAVHGRRAGLLITLGLCTGLIVHTTAVVFGLATLIATSNLAFNALNLVGAVYLTYLAVVLWRDAHYNPVEAHKFPQKEAHCKVIEEPTKLRRMYSRGILMNITNPKVSIFFLAFLPQFISPSSEKITHDIIILGVIFILITLLIFGFIAITAGEISPYLRKKPQILDTLNKLSAALFLGLAIRLLFMTLE